MKVAEVKLVLNVWRSHKNTLCVPGFCAGQVRGREGKGHLIIVRGAPRPTGRRGNNHLWSPRSTARLDKMYMSPPLHSTTGTLFAQRSVELCMCLLLLCTRNKATVNSVCISFLTTLLCFPFAEFLSINPAVLKVISTHFTDRFKLYKLAIALDFPTEFINLPNEVRPVDYFNVPREYLPSPKEVALYLLMKWKREEKASVSAKEIYHFYKNDLRLARVDQTVKNKLGM